jgi:hypothetical protein
VRVVPALILAALALGGCAGGDDGPTRAGWAGEANDVCRTYERRIEALGSPTTADEAETFIRRALPLAREELAKLRAIDRPAGDDARIEQMLGAVDDGIGALDDVLRAREAGDEAAAADATARGRQAADRANGIARRLGATVCASSSSP